MIRYEWLVETVDEHEDITDVSHWDTFAQAQRDAARVAPDGCKLQVGLVRDFLNEDDNDELESREWAYLENGVLPAVFTDGRRVPKRFAAEVAAALGR
jgi:hypothetical protein